MDKKIFWKDGWEFTEEFSERVFKKGEKLKKVRLPHTAAETPFHYFDESCYQMTAGYRNYMFAKKEWAGKHVLLTFEGVAHEAIVYVNQKEVGRHACGYTAFTVDLAPYLNLGEENQIAVSVNSCEDLNIPPFGKVIDYMTYGGIYRDVYYEIKEPVYVADIFVTTSNHMLPDKTVEAEVTLNTWVNGLFAEVSVRKQDTGETVTFPKTALKDMTQTLTGAVKNASLWELDCPVLYECKVTLYDGTRRCDEKTVRFGFREAKFLADGFYLNGEKVKIRGLNRHQSYPYVGYAMPKSLQIHDADILKFELGANAVRTSHYPQSQYFIDRCDEIGLLVFTEMPGWQHIGDAEWKEAACRNVEEMVLQYRNHASIIMWGVRINESPDDDAFYKETNAIAHKLDHTRPTGGVRCSKKSRLLEDVYTYNDFSYEGNPKKRGVEKKKKVTSKQEAPYLVSEYNGHMFPTKAFDSEEHRVEHALRHAKVLNALARESGIAGGFGWCMADYNTHKDFGSGDRICYHGVLDMFRNPKIAAFVYQSQQEKTPVLEIGSSMDIGEHPGCYMRSIYAFTNADRIRFYKNGVFIKEYDGKDTSFQNLLHGPILIDDMIGNQLVEKEGFSKIKSDAVKKVLSDAMTYGMNNLPFRTKLTAARLMAFHGMKVDDAVSLYNRYIGIWGGEAVSYRFEAVKGGETVKVVEKSAARTIKLSVNVSHTELVEETGYDVASIRLRIVDEHGNTLPYYQEPLRIKSEGVVACIGPDIITLKGGMGGIYVKTIGQGGTGRIILSGAHLEDSKIEFSVKIWQAE